MRRQKWIDVSGREPTFWSTTRKGDRFEVYKDPVDGLWRWKVFPSRSPTGATGCSVQGYRSAAAARYSAESTTRAVRGVLPRFFVIKG